MKNLKLLTVILAGIGSLLSQSCAQPDDVLTQNSDVTARVKIRDNENSPVIIQLFNWPFRKIEDEVSFLAKAGYTHVHVSPPQLSIDTNIWWGRYQPVDYRVIDGPLGDLRDFKSMINTAHRHGVRIVVDVILNHMANFDRMEYGVPYKEGVPEVLEYPNHRYREKYGLSVMFTAEHFNRTGCVTDWNDRFQQVFFRLCDLSRLDRGLPDLDFKHPHVLRAQRDYLRSLKSMGVDGFRIDGLKHLDEDYINRVLAQDISSNMLVFGEVIGSQSGFKRDIEPYLRKTRVRLYDFPLVHTIREAFNYDGNLGRMLENPVMHEAALTDDRAVTFIVNHDIPNNGGTFSYLSFEEAEELMAHAFILGRKDGIPYLYSHLGASNETGISNDQHKYYHRRPSILAMVQFRNAVAGTDQTWILLRQSQIAWTRGSRGFGIVNKAGHSYEERDIPVNLEDGEYVDVVQMRSRRATMRFEVRGGKIVSLNVPGRTAGLFVKRN